MLRVTYISLPTKTTTIYPHLLFLLCIVFYSSTHTHTHTCAVCRHFPVVFYGCSKYTVFSATIDETTPTVNIYFSLFFDKRQNFLVCVKMDMLALLISNSCVLLPNWFGNAWRSSLRVVFRVSLNQCSMKEGRDNLKLTSLRLLLLLLFFFFKIL